MRIQELNYADYLASQSKGEINLSVAGMMAFLEDGETKINLVMSHQWFNIMVKNFLGKEEFTLEEIQENYNGLTFYIMEVIDKLFEMDKISDEIIISLSEELNQIYIEKHNFTDNIEKIVNLLNRKVNKIDTFKLILEKEDSDEYFERSEIVAICKIGSLIDKRVFTESTKLAQIRKDLKAMNLVTSEKLHLKKFIMDIVNMPREDVGQVYLGLCNVRRNSVVQAIMKIIEQYHFQSEFKRKTIYMDRLIKKILREENLAEDYKISTDEIYDYFIETKIKVKEAIIPIVVSQIEGAPSMKESYEAEIDETEYDEDVYERIQRLCSMFAMTHKNVYETPSDRQKKEFNINYKNKDIYMAYDDTLTNSGKRGVIITRQGIFCRTLLGKPTYMSFKDLTENKYRIYLKRGAVYAGNKTIASVLLFTRGQYDFIDLFRRIGLIL